MRVLILSTFLAMAGAFSAPAIAAPTCLLEIDGRRHIDGNCQAVTDRDGRLVLGDNGGAAAVIRPGLGDSDRAGGAWQGGSTGRIESLGPLQRDGVSCWRGTGVRVC